MVNEGKNRYTSRGDPIYLHDPVPYELISKHYLSTQDLYLMGICSKKGLDFEDDNMPPYDSE